MAVSCSVVVIGRSFALADDEPGDLRGVGFIAQFEQCVGQFALADPVDDGGGGLAARGVHAHVQRAGLAIGEPAGRVVDLRAGDAQVGQDAHRRCRGRPRPERSAGRRSCCETVRNSPPMAASFWRRDAILAGSKSMAMSRPPGWIRQDGGGMTAEPERAIDDDLARPGVEDIEHISQQDGNMSCVALHMNHLMQAVIRSRDSAEPGNIRARCRGNGGCRRRRRL